MPDLKTLHEKVLDAQVQVVFLQQTAYAIHIADALEWLDSMWFAGLEVDLQQVHDVLLEVLNTLDKLQEAEKAKTDTE